jgi:ribosomal protein L37AE/L43A
MWLNKVTEAHECPTPEADESRENNAGVGSTWKCDECGKVWEMIWLGQMLAQWKAVSVEELAN